MVIKHLENKIRLVGIICTAFLQGVSSSAYQVSGCPDMVTGRAEKVYVLAEMYYTRNPHDDGRNMDVEARARRNVPPLLFYSRTGRKYIRYTMEKAMYWSRDGTGTVQYSRKRDFTPIYWVRARCSDIL